MKSFAGLVLGVGYDTEYTVMNNMLLWFLPAMFFVRVISGFLSRYKSRVKIAVCAAGLIIVVLLHRFGVCVVFVGVFQYGHYRYQQLQVQQYAAHVHGQDIGNVGGFLRVYRV